MSILGSLTGVKYWCGEDEGVPGKHSYPQGVPGPKRFGNHCSTVIIHSLFIFLSVIRTQGAIGNHTNCLFEKKAHMFCLVQ